TIRKFSKEPWSPIQLIQKGTVNAEIYAYIWMAVEYENSLMVVGGTGSGKTSFINTVAFFIPPQARVVSIEDTRELQLEHENWLPSVARAGVGLTNLVGQRYGEVSLFDLLRASFRQRPDYIIVGEVRGKEAFVLFQAFASGHPGMATMHAENVSTLIKRLETEPINLSPSLIETLAAVIVMSQTRVKGKEVRKVSSIDEIVQIKEGIGGEIINTVFKWDPKTDVFSFNSNSKVFENIAVHFGMTKEQVLNEFRLRANLLKELYKRGILGFKEVQKVIQEYFKQPQIVLKRYNLK
ncbi:MAG: type II/IV secretion system ATPase subunit, partial [Nanoarchaeota archaeon]